MKKFILVVVIILLILGCNYKNSPVGTYVSNIIERDTLFVLGGKLNKEDSIYFKRDYQDVGYYHRHIYYDDTLRIHKGIWLHDINLETIYLYDWHKYVDEWKGYYQIETNKRGREYIVLSLGFGYWSNNVNSIWLGSYFDPPEKYVKIK